MRAGWRSATLGELLVKTATVDPSKHPNDPFTYIDVSSVSNLTFSVSEASELLGKDAPSRARRHVKEGDVIFATVRPTLQRIAIIPAEYDGAICSTGYFVMRAGPRIDRKYLFYWLFSDVFSAEMEARQKGASYPAVNDSDIRGQKIPLPPSKISAGLWPCWMRPSPPSPSQPPTPKKTLPMRGSWFPLLPRK